MILRAFVQGQDKILSVFEQEWAKNHSTAPELFPLAMSGDEWLRMFAKWKALRLGRCSYCAEDL